MLIVTIFLGGWALPFFHRDGLTIAFGDTVILKSLVPHVWMTVIGALAFFGKVLFVCWVQCFVRWSLPRFRYDQLMKLGWRILLPASLANILVTGVVWLALDEAGPDVAAALRQVQDLTQAIIAAVIAYFFFRLVTGLMGTSTHERTLLGSSAEAAARRGGTKTAPMQA
jgi:NADH-quinone oxidoreductase subunit H